MALTDTRGDGFLSLAVRSTTSAGIPIPIPIPIPMSGKGAAVLISFLGAKAGVLMVCAADDGSSIIGAGGATG